VNSVGQENFDWIVNAVAELAIKKAHQQTGRASEYRWSGFLGDGSPASAENAKVAPARPSKRTAATSDLVKTTGRG